MNEDDETTGQMLVRWLFEDTAYVLWVIVASEIFTQIVTGESTHPATRQISVLIAFIAACLFRYVRIRRFLSLSSVPPERVVQIYRSACKLTCEGGLKRGTCPCQRPEVCAMQKQKDFEERCGPDVDDRIDEWLRKNKQ